MKLEEAFFSFFFSLKTWFLHTRISLDPEGEDGKKDEKKRKRGGGGNANLGCH